MKRLMIKVGEYEKDGQTKGQYARLGVIMSNENGEYALLDPSVDLAGCLMKQRILAGGKPKGKGDMVFCSIFEDQPQQQQSRSQPSTDYDDGSDIPF